MADDLKLAQELYQDALDATRDQRTQIEEDLRFSDPSNPEQWDAKVKRQRETDPGGARPCLVMDHTGQYVANVAGQVTQNPPAIHSVPVGDGADVKVSEQVDGVMRHIEYASRAQTHYGIALTSAARAGVGHLIIRPEVCNEKLNYQEPRISSQADPLRVVLDPWSVALDGSDADFGYVLTSLSLREYKRRFPKADPVSFGDESQRMVRDDRTSIIIAEQWLREERTRNVIQYITAEGQEATGSEDEYWKACKEAGMTLPAVGTKSEKYRCVLWRTLSGSAILDEPEDKDGEKGLYPAESIGIVPVYGYWGVKDGRMTYCGIPRRAMNPQRAYNYHMSEQLAYMASAPKSPWVGPARAFMGKGIQELWERAAVDNRAFLPYIDIDDNGNPIQAPTRTPLAVNLQNHVQGAQQALQDIEAAIGMYRANLGAPSNETSGVAIDARKQQGEAATANFPQNLAASLGQVGRVCLQMMPKLIDTARVQRILGIDGKPGTVYMDPSAPKQAERRESDGVLVINPDVGEYDVRVVVGASYSTQRSQAQDALNQVMTRNPALTPAIAPLWAQTLDFPHADKLAQVLTAMAPQPVQAILNPEAANQPTPEQLMHENEQLKQQMQQMGGQMQEMAGKLKKAEDDDFVERYNADTSRVTALANAFKAGLHVSVDADKGITATPLVMPGGPPGMQQPNMSPPSAGNFSPAEGFQQ